MTIEEAKQGLIDLPPFPVLEEGDIVWYPDENGHRFKWEGGEWISHPPEE